MKKILFYTLAASFLLMVFAIPACKKTDLKMSTTEDVNITGYLEKNADSFSLFKQILDRTETSAFLNAYGAYTCFAPTNSGVKKWFAKINVSSVETADINILKDMVKFHLKQLKEY